ncbi:phosphotransferase [Aureispira]|nr:phosphotransferase [Aureispira sp.]
MNTIIKENIYRLYKAWSGEKPLEILALPQSGSERQYFRLKGANHQALAVYNLWDSENKTFIDYTKHFRSKGLTFPEIYAQDLDNHIYLIQDLGNTTLFNFLDSNRTGLIISDNVISFYKKALSRLAFMQIKGIEGLNIEQYHNPPIFDQQAMKWDLQYFKYCYLKPSKIIFDEQLLENDFNNLISYLSAEEFKYFMFRDFQSRNIMMEGEELYFIDYQGGKYGPLQYDVVSLLFQAKANLPNDLRQELLDHYILEASKYISFDIQKFKDKYYGYVLIRTLQVLGAYGFKGLFEGKNHFITSIPFALKNLSWLLKNIDLPLEIDYLKKVLKGIIDNEHEQKEYQQKADKLTVRIQSFSFKKGIPEDPSGNGGGFVFDCRFIHNPGRYEPYKKLTGRDKPVIDFFNKKSTINDFVKRVEAIIDEAVETYIERGFASLCINFGCTGGQHRSVFSADYIAKHLKSKYPVSIVLHHREQENKNWIN